MAADCTMDFRRAIDTEPRLAYILARSRQGRLSRDRAVGHPLTPQPVSSQPVKAPLLPPRIVCANVGDKAAMLQQFLRSAEPQTQHSDLTAMIWRCLPSESQSHWPHLVGQVCQATFKKVALPALGNGQ